MATPVKTITEIINVKDYSKEKTKTVFNFLGSIPSLKNTISTFSRTNKVNLLKSFRIEVFPQNSTIFSVGDLSKNFYILLQGQISKSVVKPNGTSSYHDIIVPGSSIGSLTSSTVTRSFTCTTTCVLISFPVSKYRNIIDAEIIEQLNKRLKFINNYFPCIQQYSVSIKDKIATYLTPVHYAYSDILVEKGSCNEYLYFLIKGECAITTHSHNYGKYNILNLAPGSVLGEEWCLLSQVPSYTIEVSSSSAVLFMLKKQDLHCIPEETREAWKGNYKFKEKERNLLSSKKKTQLRSSLPLHRQSRLSLFPQATTTAKVKINLVSLRNKVFNHDTIANDRNLKRKTILERLKICHPSWGICRSTSVASLHSNYSKLSFT